MPHDSNILKKRSAYSFLENVAQCTTLLKSTLIIGSTNGSDIQLLLDNTTSSVDVITELW